MAKQSRIQRKLKSKHRAHKRDSIPAQPVVLVTQDNRKFVGRDERKRYRRAVKAAAIAERAKAEAKAQVQAALAQENAQ